MTIRNRLSFFLFTVVLAACNNGPTDDAIPLATFSDITIDINFPEFTALRTQGGYKEISGGVRGIIVYRSGATSFQAYEKNCSFHPNDACATVSVNASGIFMSDPCCNSNFSFADGSPTGGPAWRPLRRYRTQFSGTTLTISDEALN